MTLKIACIPGDGIGPEVVEQALCVLREAAELDKLDYQTETFPFSAAHFIETGHVLDDDDIATLRKFDAILLGAVGGKPNDSRLAGGVIEKGILLKLRFELDQYINLRPVRLYPGIATPLRDRSNRDIDFIVVRENTEDLYCGIGGIVRRNTPNEIASQTMIATRFGTERCIRYAFELARSRKAQGYPGKLTLVHKTNVLTYAGDTWHRTFKDVAAQYGDIETEYHHVDACCMFMVLKPDVYDVIVVLNMFGDIITDLGAAIAGGMGIAASGNLQPDGDAPSMFEPVHGSAPDIAGQNKANPIATIDSLGLLLRETGRIKQNTAAIQAGERVGRAVQGVTPKFEGKSLDRSGYTCDEVGTMVMQALS
ncbi:MAG: 3-isopropylmalate dehydrogenase [Rhodospirillales bacterium]|nr:3-isopropylmalate dehydrogenase [Rhodospirillales bacterium]